MRTVASTILAVSNTATVHSAKELGRADVLLPQVTTRFRDVRCRSNSEDSAQAEGVGGSRRRVRQAAGDANEALDRIYEALTNGP